MSKKPMSNNAPLGPGPSARVDMLDSMKRCNDLLQEAVPYGSTVWHIHESIDDRIHELLQREGE